MRIAKLQHAMHIEGIELFVLQDRRNIAYFTGVKDISGHVYLHQRGKPVFYVQDKQFDQASMMQPSGMKLVKGQPDYADHLVDELRSEASALEHVAFDSLNVSNYTRITRELDIEPVLARSLVASLQRFYDKEEMRLVQKAAAIADAGFAAARETLRPGVTELEVLGQMQYTFRREGSEWDTFRVFGSGVRSAYSEALPCNRVIERGDMVFIDIGPTYQGYRADITRAYMVGKPSARQRRILDALVAVESTAIQLAKAGIVADELDAQVRRLVTDAGFNDYLHHTGHSLTGAFEIVPGNTTVLERGDVICLEPGIYVPSVGGGRLEDEMLVTKGDAMLLSHANRDPYLNG